MVTSAQLRAARGLVNWTVRDLAEKAGVHRNTVTRAETDETEHGHAVAQIVLTLEANGVEFINDEQPGVRVRGYVYRLSAYPQGFNDPSWSTTLSEKLLWIRASDQQEARQIVAEKTFAGAPLKWGTQGLTSPWTNERLTSCIRDGDKSGVPFGAIITSDREIAE